MTIVLILAFVGHVNAGAQELLSNPSFEGEPLLGGGGYSVNLIVDDWMDWNQRLFPHQSPPDVHSASSSFWGVTTKPLDGETFIGLVVRATRTWEAVAQKLKAPLKPGHRYLLSVYVCRDPAYHSPTADAADRFASFASGTVLRISAAAKPGSDEAFLWQSAPVQHTQWERVECVLEPNETFKYVVLGAYYDPARDAPYNGNLMLDKVSLTEIGIDERR